MLKNDRKSYFLNRKRFLKFSAAALCCSASVQAIDSVCQFQPDTFSKSEVVINNKTIPISDFYDCLHYDFQKNKWIYTNAEGKNFDLDSISDYRIKDEQRYKSLVNQKDTVIQDTVIIHYPDGAPPGSLPSHYELGNNKHLTDIPDKGTQIFGEIHIREFVVDKNLPEERRQKLQHSWDINNDSLNYTSDHEKRHRKHERLGLLRAGQSYDNVYIEGIADEIVANIAQLLAQRENYLKHDRDSSKIVPRFAFYTDAIREGKIKPYPKIYTKKEIDIIGNGVFDMWMEKNFDIYKDMLTRRARSILFQTNANGIKEDSLKHQELLKNMFQIDGLNFYEALEAKIATLKVPEDVQKTFSALVKKRIKNMSYLEKLEELRIKEGPEAVNKHLWRNKIYYSIHKGRS